MTNSQQNDKVSTQPSIELVAENGLGFYVCCQLSDDRFTHEIGVIADTQRIRVLISSEGNSDDVWPCSPPLQQIHQQEIDDGPVLLGVGMSGASHYSTSMLLTKKSSSVELQIESACVAKPTANDIEMFLGSRLNWSEDFNVFNNEYGSSLVMQQKELPSVEISTDTSQCRMTQTQPRQLEIAPRKIQLPGTIQWGYRLQLQDLKTSSVEAAN